MLQVVKLLFIVLQLKDYQEKLNYLSYCLNDLN